MRMGVPSSAAPILVSDRSNSGHDVWSQHVEGGNGGISAATLLAEVREDDLARLIHELGEEPLRRARLIAARICERRCGD